MRKFAFVPIYLALAVSARLPASVSDTKDDAAILPYLDSSIGIEERLEDLMGRMTLEEKVGQLFIKPAAMGPNGTIDDTTKTANYTTETLITQKLMTHFNLQNSGAAKDMATWANRMQSLALQTRLKIPITIATDPRHAFAEAAGSAISANSFSQWPEGLGIAALRDPGLTQRYAEVIREEYLAVSIRSALQPQIDVVTDPRLGRGAQTFGEDANLTSEMVVALIKGFQGETLGPHSITTVTKHFPGAGPARGGRDSHFPTGKDLIYPGNNFDYHLEPFRAAIAAGARQIMPSYARPVNTSYPEVGMSFNKPIITDLLRGDLNFTGIVVSDWALVHDFIARGQNISAISWGVEHLSVLEKTELILNAGVDQFGGEIGTELVLELVKSGRISEERIDRSVRLLLREKFLLGLFKSRFVDPETAVRIVGKPYFRQLGEQAQRSAYTLLTNRANVLPIRIPACSKPLRFFVQGLNASYLTARNLTTVSSATNADYALLRISTPYETFGGPFEQAYHQGRLDFNSSVRAFHAALFATVPTIVDIYLDRPAVIPEIADGAAALLANYGAGVDAFLDVVFGIDGAEPRGRLPFDLPRSMRAVEEQESDVPFDTFDPVFRFGDGLRYGKEVWI